MIVAPALAVDSTPPGPAMTASTISEFGSMVIMISLCAATSAIDAQRCPPRSLNAAVCAVWVSNPQTSVPLLTIFAAIDRPIRPSPINPILSILFPYNAMKAIADLCRHKSYLPTPHNIEFKLTVLRSPLSIRLELISRRKHRGKGCRRALLPPAFAKSAVE